MKKIFISLLLILGVSFAGASQITYSYGLKGGVNQSMGGTIEGYPSGINPDTGTQNWAGVAEGSGELGFQFGAFGQINLGRFFIRPEIVYTSMERKFDFPNYPDENVTPYKASSHSVQKLDIPFLAGYNVWGPIDIYAGGVYSNIMNTELEGEEYTYIDRVIVQNAPINVQAGIKAEFGRFGIDLRYEHSLSTEEQQDIDLARGEFGVNRGNYYDFAFDLVKVNVTFKIGGSDVNPGRRRGRSCY